MQRSDLVGPPQKVAPIVLGARLSHHTPAGTVTVEITEVEAYSGETDPASHAYRGLTERNRVMFGEAGHLYVYFTYGMHWCANIVTGEVGQGWGLLLRAGQVVEGVELARERRGPRVSDRNLARGPACVAQALGIDQSLGGTDVFAGSPLLLQAGRTITTGEIATGPRVGVRLAADVPWRFWIAGDPTVSAYRRNRLAAPAPKPRALDP